MIDISILEDYLEPVDDFDEEYVASEINRIGLEELYKHQLHQLDCTIIKGGYRLQQTIGYGYVAEMTRTLYLIENYFQDDIDSKLAEVLDLHNKNIEFEKLNPPIIYGGKKYKNKHKEKDATKPARRGRQARIRFDENGEPIKSAAERKLAMKVARLNALKFNFKPINNGNNTL